MIIYSRAYTVAIMWLCPANNRKSYGGLIGVHAYYLYIYLVHILIKYCILLERLFPRRPCTSFNYYYNLHQTRDMHAWKRFVCRITTAVGDIATVYCNIRNGHLIINHSGCSAGVGAFLRSNGGLRGGCDDEQKRKSPFGFHPVRRTHILQYRKV